MQVITPPRMLIMTKVFSLLFLTFFIVACNKNDNGKDCASFVQAEESASTDCTVTDDQPVIGDTTGGTTTGVTSTGGTSTGGLPNEAFTFDANVTFYNVTSIQEAKFRRALGIIKDVVATEEFRTKVLNHTYGGKKTYVDNGGFTNAQIYQKILDGAETLQKVVDNEMDMEVELYYASTSTVGYTYANSKRIWVNRKFFDQYTAASVASNLFHEWLHKLGFSHASTWSTSRDYSVPYAIGRIIGEIGKDFL
jgi:hypothetical protein